MTALRRVSSSRFLRDDLRVAVLPWAVARVLVGAALWMARFVYDRLGSHSHAHSPRAGLFVYDGGWYRAIAEHGYAHLPREALRFFPLYPLLGRALGWVFFDHTAAALVVLANGVALLLGATLHRLVLIETGDRQLARRAVWYVAVFPALLSLVLAYAEALMMLAAVGAFLAWRSRRLTLAVAFGVLAALARPVGILLLVPAAVEAARAWRTADMRERLGWGAAVLAPLAGTAIYLVWVWRVFGDGFAPYRVQARHDLRGASVDPVTHLVDVVRDVVNGARFEAPLHLLWLALFVVLLVVLVRRLPASYAAYAGAALVLGLTADNVSSFERYAASTFPMIIGLALLTGRRDVDRTFTVASASALVALGALAFLGLYVP